MIDLAISERARRMLEGLRQLTEGWTVFRRREIVRLLEDLGRTGEPLVALCLHPLACSRAVFVSRAARSAIRQLLEDIPPLVLVALDGLARDDLFPLGPLKREEVLRPQPSGSDLLFVLGISSFHPDGRIREEAVRALALSRDGREIPFLLLRANDWVEEVRRIARAAIHDRIVPAFAPAFFHHLSLVLRLESCGRDRHEELVRAVRDLLASPEARGALQEGCRNPDGSSRRASFQIAIEARILPLCLKGLDERDPLVRLRCARLVLSQAALQELPGFLDRLRRDPFVPVRRAALEVSAERFPEETEAFLVDALLDRNIGVREIAAYHLRKRGTIDPAAFYRDRLAALRGRPLEAAILGLGAQGRKEDALTLRALFPGNPPGIQRAVLRSLSMLDAEAHLDLLSEALISGSPGVSKEAREVLRRRRVWIDRSRLEGDLARGGPVHGRKNVLRVLAELSRFDALPSLLLGAGDPEEEVRAVAVKLLKRWIFDYNRCHVRPTPEQLSRARKALEEARERLPSELYRELFYYTGQTD